MMIIDVVAAILIVQLLAAVLLKVAIMWPQKNKTDMAEPEIILLNEPSESGARYTWAQEKAILRGKTVREQRKILSHWIDETVESMHAPRKDVEMFFKINLGEVLN
jgi:hypothetical protein